MIGKKSEYGKKYIFKFPLFDPLTFFGLDNLEEPLTKNVHFCNFG